MYGAIHGQEVSAKVELNKAQDLDGAFTDFFGGRGAKFDIVLRFNDHKQNMWEVVRISRDTSIKGS